MAAAPNGEKIIVHASNFRKVKRVEDVIRVFKALNDALPSKLLLLGDGPERPFVESLSRDLGLFEDVKFLGKQEQMEDILPIADLFLLPSERPPSTVLCLQRACSKSTGDRDK